MDSEQFDVTADSHFVKTVTDWSKAELLERDVAESAVLYLDGRQYYGEFGESPFAAGTKTAITVTIDEAPPDTILEATDAITIGITGQLYDWLVETKSVHCSETQDGSYKLTFQRLTIEIVDK